MAKRVLLISQSNSPAPNDNMKEILMKTVEEAKALISKVRIALIQYEIHTGTVPYVCANPPSETSSSECVSHHGDGKGSPGPAQGSGHDCISHGFASS